MHDRKEGFNTRDTLKLCPYCAQVHFNFDKTYQTGMYWNTKHVHLVKSRPSFWSVYVNIIEYGHCKHYHFGGRIISVHVYQHEVKTAGDFWQKKMILCHISLEISEQPT